MGSSSNIDYDREREYWRNQRKRLAEYNRQQKIENENYIRNYKLQTDMKIRHMEDIVLQQQEQFLRKSQIEHLKLLQELNDLNLDFQK